MPIAAAASNALKSQKAKANQQEMKTKAGADPELLNFLSDQNPSKLWPKTNMQILGPVWCHIPVVSVLTP